MDIVLAFVTGLTTGGLSCLAVQGGLLAGSIAHEVEQTVQGRPVKVSAAGRRRVGPQPRAARPILLFLLAKLVVYTAFGSLLGLLGSVIQLTPLMRAVMQAAIGVFMVGTALRMLNVHPIFRFFVLEPPHVLTRYIRRKARGEASAVTPLFLGALSVLIPCGVTQAMMAVAIGTGSPLAGAVTMFAFTLGTSPVFFAVAYLATRLGARLEAGFMRGVAVVVLLLGLISIDAGLTLGGSPYSITNLRMGLELPGVPVAQAEVQAQAPAPAAAAPTLVPTPPTITTLARPAATASRPRAEIAGPQRPTATANGPAATAVPQAAAAAPQGPAAKANVLTIKVAANGYSPKVLHAKPGQALSLALVTNKTNGCARAFVIPALRVEKLLPVTGTVMIEVPAQRAGSKLYYSCSMGMYSGVIIFDA